MGRFGIVSRLGPGVDIRPTVILPKVADPERPSLRKLLRKALAKVTSSFPDELSIEINLPDADNVIDYGLGKGSRSCLPPSPEPAFQETHGDEFPANRLASLTMPSTTLYSMTACDP